MKHSISGKCEFNNEICVVYLDINDREIKFTQAKFIKNQINEVI